MSDTLKLGQIITGDAARDCIHIAIAPVVASEELVVAQDVGFLPDGTVGPCDCPIGVVDPFLPRGVDRGERFWVFLYPNTVTGMTHHWSHPAFPPKALADYLSKKGAGE